MPELILISVVWSDYKYFYTPLDRKLAHDNATFSKFNGSHWHMWVEDDNVWTSILHKNTKQWNPNQGLNGDSSIYCASHFSEVVWNNFQEQCCLSMKQTWTNYPLPCYWTMMYTTIFNTGENGSTYLHFDLTVCKPCAFLGRKWQWSCFADAWMLPHSRGTCWTRCLG